MNPTIKQITTSGTLTGIAILFGVFVHFPLFGGYVALVGVVTFLFPLVLRLDFALIATIVSVVVTDVISGYSQYAWMSALAYSSTVFILWGFSHIKLKLAYMIGTFLSMISLIAIYFLIELAYFDLSFALKDLTSTSLEMLIVFSTTAFLFRPTKMISNALV